MKRIMILTFSLGRDKSYHWRPVQTTKTVANVLNREWIEKVTNDSHS